MTLLLTLTACALSYLLSYLAHSVPDREDYYAWRALGKPLSSTRPDGLVVRDRMRELVTERDEARRERDEAISGWVQSGLTTINQAQRDEAIQERDAARSEVARLTKERDEARTERDDYRERWGRNQAMTPKERRDDYMRHDRTEQAIEQLSAVLDRVLSPPSDVVRSESGRLCLAACQEDAARSTPPQCTAYHDGHAGTGYMDSEPCPYTFYGDRCQLKQGHDGYHSHTDGPSVTEWETLSCPSTLSCGDQCQREAGHDGLHRHVSEQGHSTEWGEM